MEPGREIELKLRVPPGDAARLGSAAPLRRAQSARAHATRMLGFYFDTPDHALASAGIALRLRKEGRRWVQTLKGPAQSGSGAGMAARLEYEADRGAGARPPALDATQWGSTPWQPLLARAQARGLAARFATDYRRTALPVALDDGTRATVCVDVGEVRDGTGRATPICEMEIELEDGRVDALYRFAQALAQDVALRVEPASKAQRGYALIGAVKRQPARAERAALEPDDRAAAALQTLLRGCARQVADNADGVLAEDDPEWVHQLRVGTRRLRACLALLRDVVPEHSRATVLGDAQWLARALGPVRDLDVLATETLPAARSALGSRDRDAQRAIDAFARRVDAARHEAREAARAAVASPRFTRLVLGTGSLAATPGFGVPATSRAGRVLSGAARTFARPWLARRHRKLVRRARGLAKADIDERHAVRLAAKRLRYATEFFAGLFDHVEARAYRRALAALQEALGRQVDVQVGLRLARAMEGAGSPAARILEAHAADASRTSMARVMRRWRAFRKCRPFFESR
jgi:triphosphatase